MESLLIAVEMYLFELAAVLAQVWEDGSTQHADYGELDVRREALLEYVRRRL